MQSSFICLTKAYSGDSFTTAPWQPCSPHRPHREDLATIWSKCWLNALIPFRTQGHKHLVRTCPMQFLICLLTLWETAKEHFSSISLISAEHRPFHPLSLRSLGYRRGLLCTSIKLLGCTLELAPPPQTGHYPHLLPCPVGDSQGKWHHGDLAFAV